MQAVVTKNGKTVYDCNLTLEADVDDCEWLTTFGSRVPNDEHVSVLLQQPPVQAGYLFVRPGNVLLDCEQFLWNRLEELAVGNCLSFDLKFSDVLSTPNDAVYEIGVIRW